MSSDGLIGACVAPATAPGSLRPGVPPRTPLDAAADAGQLLCGHRRTREQRVDRRPQLVPGDGHVAAGPAAVEAAPVGEAALAVEEEEVGGARRAVGAGHLLGLVHQVRERVPGPFRLPGHVLGRVVGVLVPVVALHADHREPALLPLGAAPGEHRADVLHVRAVVADEHHQHARGVREVAERVHRAAGIRQREVRRRGAERHHRRADGHGELRSSRRADRRHVPAPAASVDACGPSGGRTCAVRHVRRGRSQMGTTVDEVAEGIFRISTTVPGFTFNQYLVCGERALLFHTGPRGMFADVSAAAFRVVAPEQLAWVAYGHYEADECGSLNEWLHAAPNATPAQGATGVLVSLGDLADREPRALTDGEVLDLGGKRVRWLDTPHVPHGWDAGLLHEESTGTLLCGDLFTLLG